jgi:PKD repeat protein
MRTYHALAFVLGLARLGTACSGEGAGPSNTPPAAAFTPTCVLLACTFADSSTDADGRLTAYTWDFGDGTAAAITKDAVHRYGIASTYSVRLTVTDNDGATSDTTESVLVHAPANVPPTAAFTSSCADLTCTFTDLSSDRDGTVVGFHWDFGSGVVAESRNPTHTFASAGTYVVALIAVDDSGGTDSFSQRVTVTAPETTAPEIALRSSPWLQNLCYPARQYSTRGCPSEGSVTISNTGGGTLKWTATTSAPWLKTSPASGTAPSTVRVWVDGAALPAGSSSGDVLLSATGAINSPRGVFVHVTR